MVLRTQFLRIKLQGIFNVRILHSLNLIKRKDNVTPYNTFEDNRKIPCTPYNSVLCGVQCREGADGEMTFFLFPKAMIFLAIGTKNPEV